ncbi:MAG: hypothetical protein ABI457_07720 [Hyphomicrobium sp.]
MDAKQRRKPLDAATLALIKIDVEESDLTLDEMSVKYDRAASYLSRLSREKGWLTRAERLGRRPRSAPVLSLGVREEIARRISRVINKKLDQMEKGMESGEFSAEDAERGGKMVTSMLGGLEKVVARAEGPDAEEEKRASPTTTTGVADEVERLQREIIERFERIQRRRDAERGSA